MFCTFSSKYNIKHTVFKFVRQSVLETCGLKIKMCDGNHIPQKQSNWKLKLLVFMKSSGMVVWKSIIILGNTHIFPNCNWAGKLFNMIAVLSELGTLSKAINCDEKPTSFKSFLSFLVTFMNSLVSFTMPKCSNLSLTLFLTSLVPKNYSFVVVENNDSNAITSPNLKCWPTWFAVPVLHSKQMVVVLPISVFW